MDGIFSRATFLWDASLGRSHSQPSCQTSFPQNHGRAFHRTFGTRGLGACYLTFHSYRVGCAVAQIIAGKDTAEIMAFRELEVVKDCMQVRGKHEYYARSHRDLTRYRLQSGQRVWRLLWTRRGDSLRPTLHVSPRVSQTATAYAVSPQSSPVHRSNYSMRVM